MRRIRTSSFFLTATRRSALSWTRWRLRRLYRRQQKEQRRQKELLLALDRQNLRLKEREETVQLLLHRLVEMRQSEAFRLTGALPPLPERTQLDQLLGLER